MMLDKEKRVQRKIEELGRNAKCEICGEENYATLVKINTSKLENPELLGIHTEKCVICRKCKAKHGKKKQALVESHHIAGGHEGDTIPACLNSHAILTDTQLDWPEGVLSKDRTTEMESVGFFLGIGAILALLAAYCWKHAIILYNFVVQTQGVN